MNTPKQDETKVRRYVIIGKSASSALIDIGGDSLDLRLEHRVVHENAYDALSTEKAAIEAERDRLREALEKYGGHARNCRYERLMDRYSEPGKLRREPTADDCDCGFAALSRNAANEKDGER